ncbi:MAG: glycoside hydrolase family 32 protein [Prevotellaceae bacterium]|jgi:sucrose-6-phosphate hydrolase SacC (GH32 family)|nr:glycoside hydrolase family 32 protein [Prevotellaceae bacterium]
MKKVFLSMIALCGICAAYAGDSTLTVTKRYINLPVAQEAERNRMTFHIDGEVERTFVIRLSDTPDYWVFCDMSAYRGATLRIAFDGKAAGLAKIYQDDRIAGADSLYREAARPQFHFTSRRGWNNDPNGLLFHDGEYHLFYQHNPYEREWENMHWGHAVSRDLVRWQELPPALYPDAIGTMFSGSAVVDDENTAGFNRGDTPAIVAVYTAASPERQVQCIAYSTDRGRTWTKYAGNPVVDSKAAWNSQDTRDPKVFRHAPTRRWVMVLNERDGHSIYTSANLREWRFESHVTGFWECPDLFELPVDGDTANTRWVMYGASGAYMIGRFDGRQFIPEGGKYYYTTGALYAAQTFAGIPAADGRRIQIGWGRIAHGPMPFNGMMLLPTELTLRTTKDGIRLFSNPVKEIDRLQGDSRTWTKLTAAQANRAMEAYRQSDCLRIKARIKLSHATDAGLRLHGQSILTYDMNFNTVNGVFYSPEEPTSMELSVDILIDKTSVEVFVDGGAYSYALQRELNSPNREGFRFWGNNPEIVSLEVYEMRTIWN